MSNSAVFLGGADVQTGAGLTGAGTIGDPLINSAVPVIASTQVAYATGANTLGGDAGLTYDSGSNILTVDTGGIYNTELQPAFLALAETDGFGAGLLFQEAGGGTRTSPTVTLTDEVLGDLSFQGTNSTPAFAVVSARMAAFADGAPDASTVPGRLVFFTTPVGGSSTERLRITSTGRLEVANGGAITTDTTTAHTALIQAYDVNGTTYRTFATLTNGDVPSFAISQPSGGLLLISPPTTDPHVSGAIWNNTGLVVVSTG